MNERGNAILGDYAFCIVGCYSLHLYCAMPDKCAWWHEQSVFPNEFTGRNYREAVRFARKVGWNVSTKKRIAVCPECVEHGFTLLDIVKGPPFPTPLVKFEGRCSKEQINE